MKIANSWRPIPPLCILLPLILLCWPWQAQGEQTEIEARYSQARGKQISWQVQVPSPAPAAIIVLQIIPAGTSIITSKPVYNNFDQTTGMVKWLLTSVQPGEIHMTMELDRPIRKKGEIQGKIIFQDSSTRPLAEAFITRKNRKKSIEGC